jgi:uncharacterized membrane protein
MSKQFLKKICKFKSIKKWHGLIPLAVAMVLIIPLGIYLLINVPDMWSADGGAQVARAFQIADGGIKPVFINHHEGVGYGGTIPLNVNDLKTVELTIIGQDGPAGVERQTKLITAQDKVVINQIKSQKISKEKILISYVNTAAYSPVAYLPNILGLKIGMLFNFSLGHTLLLARLCGFLTFVAVVAYSLYTLRKSGLKWIVMTVALLPLVVFQSTLITADSFLMSVAILLSAIFIKALSRDTQLTLLDKILLFACIITIPITKSVYFPLAGIILFVPRRHWATKRGYWIFTAVSLIISAALFAWWSDLTLDVAASNGLVRGDNLWRYGDAKIQQKFVLSHPFTFIETMVRTFMYQSQFYIDTYFGWLGFTYLPIPGLAFVTGFLGLGLSGLLAGKAKFEKYIPSMLAAFIAAITLIMLVTFYLAYTPLRDQVIEGMQGRYFLPLTIFGIVAMAMWLPKVRIDKNGLSSAKALLIVLVTFTLVLSIVRYGIAITT